MGEIAAAFLTDGAWLIAAMAVELVLFGFIVTDTTHAYEVCHAATTPAMTVRVE